MFGRYVRETGVGGDDPSTPQVIVLPPHSRYDPAGNRDGPLRPHPALTEESIVEDVTPSGVIDGANKRDRARSGGRAMSPPAQPRQAFVTSPRNGGRPGSVGSGAPDGSVRALNGTIVPTRLRPTSAVSSNYRNSYNVAPPSAGKRRPGSSRPTTASDTGRPDIYAMWTPGEAVLTGPALTPTSAMVGPHSARRPASEELQYELSVTASVLRAAQTRLTKEREQRQLARVGEELALVDVKRAKEEMKALTDERRSESKSLAKGMAEQRKELENELQRLEAEQEVRSAAPVPPRHRLHATHARARFPQNVGEPSRSAGPACAVHANVWVSYRAPFRSFADHAVILHAVCSASCVPCAGRCLWHAGRARRQGSHHSRPRGEGRKADRAAQRLRGPLRHRRGSAGGDARG
jgi:hypothetical protein